MKSGKNKKGGQKDVKDHQGQQSKIPFKEPTAKVEIAGNAGAKSETHSEGTKSYSKRKIVSNWDRFEEPVVSVKFNEAYEPQGSDFNELLQMPSTANSHFVFKSEQLEAPPSHSLFALNLKNLASGLSAIPFYKQVDIPADSFSVTEVEAMNRAAEAAKLLL